MTSVGSPISVSGLVRGYGSGKNRDDVLQGLDMDVQSGSVYGLLGPSGCGKTTLLKVSLGFLSPESGGFRAPSFFLQTAGHVPLDEVGIDQSHDCGSHCSICHPLDKSPPRILY